MTNREKEEILRDLWTENEDSVSERALQRMIAEGRRRRGARRTGRAVLLIAGLITTSLWLWPDKPLPRTPVPAPEPRRLLTVHHLTEAELKERLSGYAVAYVGAPGSERVVLLEEMPP